MTIAKRALLVGCSIAAATMLLFQNCGPAHLNGNASTTVAASSADTGSVGNDGGGSPTDTPTPTPTPSAAPLSSLSSASLNFGSVFIGDYATMPVTITNRGNSTLTFSSVIVAQGSFEFQLQSTGLASCSTSLAPGDSCKIYVAYSPLSTGASVGTLTISSNSANSPQTVPLSGTGLF